jgi:hypothetical protein
VGQTLGVHFEREHDFEASVERVTTLMSDPDFQSGLDLPDLARPEVVAYEVDGTSRVLGLRYEYVGQLDPIARRIVAGRKLTWVQELRVEPTTGAGTLGFSADGVGGGADGSAVVTFTATGAASCRRRISGDFRINVPLIGAVAERAIVPGLLRRLDAEADALRLSLEER